MKRYSPEIAIGHFYLFHTESVFNNFTFAGLVSYLRGKIGLKTMRIILNQIIINKYKDIL